MMIDIEFIVNNMSNNNQSSYKQLAILMNKYKRKQLSLIEVYKEFVDIFQVCFAIFPCFTTLEGF